MPETPPRYRAILTNAAFELEAEALARGCGIVLTHMAVGDANNEYVEPDSEATGLIHEVWRSEIDSKAVDPDDPNITNVRVMIPASVGGFWIREVGVFGHLESDPEREFLFIYANHAPYYKLLPVDGQSVTHELVIPVVQAGNAEITIEVRDLGYASKSEVADLRKQVESGDARFVAMAKNAIRLSDRLTRHELARLARDEELAAALEARDRREAEHAKVTVTALDRITRLELALLERNEPGAGQGGSGSLASGQTLTPAGYTTLSGAVIAPLTIVQSEAQAPAGAALGLKLIEQGV